jgi:hypothetical protein
MSKGSTPRPPSVDAKTFAANYDRIFGKGAAKRALEARDDAEWHLPLPTGRTLRRVKEPEA